MQNIKAIRELEKVMAAKYNVSGILWKECNLTVDSANNIYILFAIRKEKAGTLNYAKSFSQDVISVALKALDVASNTAQQMVIDGRTEKADIKVFCKATIMSFNIYFIHTRF